MDFNPPPTQSQDADSQIRPAFEWAEAAVATGATLAQSEVQRLVQAQVLASRQAKAHAKRIDLLSERLLRHLAPEVWQRLFHGIGRQSIAFDETPLAVVFIEALELGVCRPGHESLPALVDRLARQHGGAVDSFGWGGTALFFGNVTDGLRTALSLMHSAPEPALRIGVHSSDAVVASFRSGGQLHSTLLGSTTAEAATVSGAAAYGSIGLSAAAQDLLEDRIGVPLDGAKVPVWLFQEATWGFARTANGSLRLTPTSLAPTSS